MHFSCQTMQTQIKNGMCTSGYDLYCSALLTPRSSLLLLGKVLSVTCIFPDGWYIISLDWTLLTFPSPSFLGWCVFWCGRHLSHCEQTHLKNKWMELRLAYNRVTTPTYTSKPYKQLEEEDKQTPKTTSQSTIELTLTYMCSSFEKNIEV